jgi:hypothetical protein
MAAINGNVFIELISSGSSSDVDKLILSKMVREQIPSSFYFGRLPGSNPGADDRLPGVNPAGGVRLGRKVLHYVAVHPGTDIPEQRMPARLEKSDHAITDHDEGNQLDQTS